VRTTLTIDGDVASLLQQEMRRSGATLKDTVNKALRAGLLAANRPAQPKPYVIRPRVLGLPPGLSYDNVAELLEQIEGVAGHK